MPRIPTQNAYFIDPQAEQARGMSALEAIRGYAGAPSQASVMRPGETEAYGTGELTALAEAALPFAALGKGALGALAAGVIKPRGGNWLPGSVEKALQPVRFNEFGGTSLPETVALNRWVEGPLTKYIKRDMATEQDPVRALAEQGILHYAPEAMPRYMDDVWAAREKVGFPAARGTAPLAQRWEAYADQMVRPKRLDEPVSSIGRLNMRDMIAADPEGAWALKAPDDTMTYELRRPGASSNQVVNEELGLTHLTDELFNALNPESGLPQNLLLRPEQLQQMGMEKAVRHVHDINQWRAAQKVAADLEMANKAATVREYPDTPEFPNPEGLRWVELRAPEGTNPAYLGAGKYEDPAANELAEQLKYEGDTMGHCVGGYCPDVLAGKSRIFSLRDAKGQPHVTIELNPEDGGVYRIEQIKGSGKKDPGQSLRLKSTGYEEDKDAYLLPFVQDFVRNNPLNVQWSKVKDLINTGLVDLGVDASKRAGAPRFVTRDEYQSLRKQNPEISETGDLTERQVWDWEPDPGFADGGAVHTPVPANWRKLELGGTIGYLMGE